MPKTVSTTTSAKRAIAADLRWAYHVPDRSAATAPARQAFLDKFERLVDPQGQLRPQERAKRAANLKRAYFREMGLKSAAARRNKIMSRKARR